MSQALNKLQVWQNDPLFLLLTLPGPSLATYFQLKHFYVDFHIDPFYDLKPLKKNNVNDTLCFFLMDSWKVFICNFFIFDLKSIYF